MADFVVFSKVTNLGQFAKNMFPTVVFTGVVIMYIKLTAILIVIVHYQSRHVI